MMPRRWMTAGEVAVYMSLRYHVVVVWHREDSGVIYHWGTRNVCMGDTSPGHVLSTPRLHMGFQGHTEFTDNEWQRGRVDDT